jgi:hypothetical protein
MSDECTRAGSDYDLQLGAVGENINKLEGLRGRHSERKSKQDIN